MNVNNISDLVSISKQIHISDLALIKSLNFEVIVCNRPDGEALNQPSFSEIQEAAQALGIDAVYVPFKGTLITEEIVQQFETLLDGNKKILAYCRTGNRSCNLWATTAAARGQDINAIISTGDEHGYDVRRSLETYAPLSNQMTQIVNPLSLAKKRYDVVVVGGGSAGIAVSASLMKRDSSISIAIIEPATEHYYQPGWTMVGGGVFTPESTKRNTRKLIPKGASWIKQSVVEFFPGDDKVKLDDGQEVLYKQLVVCPGLVLNWNAIEGLEETLGKNGVTSNYRYDLAPYTWKLVNELKEGKALFTQPPMPIKCAGAPQKALYLSASHWHKKGVLKNIDLHFFNAGKVLFGVDAYVPALKKYMEKYQASVHFSYQLFKIDGASKLAYFRSADGKDDTVTTEHFDMIHVCPPQTTPDFVSKSQLTDSSGWLDVNLYTLRHSSFKNVWGLGDVINTPNAKTMAAARKQAPVVAENILSVLHGGEPRYGYDGYGSCPLTVENGKVILAEFSYGGNITPTFPDWLLNGKQPTSLAWFFKKCLLPKFYWHAMLKGREILAKPTSLSTVMKSMNS